MKKLAGLPVIAVTLIVVWLWSLFRIFTFDGDHALKWRVPLDLKIYVLAGERVAAGGNLYDTAYIRDLPFTYPPFAGVFFRWLAELPHHWLIGVWQLGSMAALTAIVLLVFNAMSVRLTAPVVFVGVMLALCSVATEPIQGTLFFGQINILLMLLVSLDLLPRKGRWPGVGVGLAAGFKLTPAYLGLVLLLQRRWWSVLGALASFAATVGIGFWLIPDARVFWTDAMFKSSRVGEHTNPGAQSMKSILTRLFGIEDSAVWLALVVVVFAITVAAVLVALRRDNPAAAMAFTGLSACLVSPFSWYHHFVWIVPLAACILIDLNRLAASRLPEWAAGLISSAAVVAMMLPFVAKPVWAELSWAGLKDHQGGGALLFAGAPLVYMVIYALSGFFDKARGRHHA